MPNVPNVPNVPLQKMVPGILNWWCWESRPPALERKSSRNGKLCWNIWNIGTLLQYQ